jgi:hypothetical protein
MPVTIKGTGGGSVTLSAAAAATDTTLTLPNTTGTVINTAPSTNGNVLTSNGTAWVSSAPAASGSLTLLATLTTTSGTTQSATGLATTYTNLLIVYEGVGNSAGNDDITIRASVDNGSTYSTAMFPAFNATIPQYGASIIFRANASVTTRAATYYGYLFNGAVSKITTTSAAPINALRFTFNSGYTFNAGTIYIYGWN